MWTTCSAAPYADDSAYHLAYVQAHLRAANDVEGGDLGQLQADAARRMGTADIRDYFPFGLNGSWRTHERTGGEKPPS